MSFIVECSGSDMVHLNEVFANNLHGRKCVHHYLATIPHCYVIIVYMLAACLALFQLLWVIFTCVSLAWMASIQVEPEFV
jgi:hypothetical protein